MARSCKYNVLYHVKTVVFLFWTVLILSQVSTTSLPMDKLKQTKRVRPELSAIKQSLSMPKTLGPHRTKTQNSKKASYGGPNVHSNPIIISDFWLNLFFFVWPTKGDLCMSLDSFCPMPQLKETRDSMASPNVRKKWLFKTSGLHYNIRWGPGQEYTGEEVRDTSIQNTI